MRQKRTVRASSVRARASVLWRRAICRSLWWGVGWPLLYPQSTQQASRREVFLPLCQVIDSEDVQMIEEGRLSTTPEAFGRRFASQEQPPMRIAIEAGTHSPWVSRLLEECGHEVL